MTALPHHRRGVNVAAQCGRWSLDCGTVDFGRCWVVGGSCALAAHVQLLTGTVEVPAAVARHDRDDGRADVLNLHECGTTLDLDEVADDHVAGDVLIHGQQGCSQLFDAGGASHLDARNELDRVHVAAHGRGALKVNLVVVALVGLVHLARDLHSARTGHGVDGGLELGSGRVVVDAHVRGLRGRLHAVLQETDLVERTITGLGAERCSRRRNLDRLYFNAGAEQCVQIASNAHLLARRNRGGEVERGRHHRRVDLGDDGVERHVAVGASEGCADAGRANADHIARA